jgi:hypothetical protein
VDTQFAGAPDFRGRQLCHRNRPQLRRPFVAPDVEGPRSGRRARARSGARPPWLHACGPGRGGFGDEHSCACGLADVAGEIGSYVRSYLISAMAAETFWTLCASCHCCRNHLMPGRSMDWGGQDNSPDMSSKGPARSPCAVPVAMVERASTAPPPPAP